jgi:purine catabolism regulator
MASLRELVQTLLPTAEPLVDARAEAMARTVTWVRLLRTRLPAFDGMDAGDLALIPVVTLRAVAPDEAARREMVEFLANSNATGILAIASAEPSKEEETALQHLVAAAAVTRLPTLLVRDVEPAQLERSLIGAVVNRRAELERQTVTLERQIAALAWMARDSMHSLVRSPHSLGARLHWRRAAAHRSRLLRLPGYQGVRQRRRRCRAI